MNIQKISKEKNHVFLFTSSHIYNYDQWYCLYIMEGLIELHSTSDYVAVIKSSVISIFKSLHFTLATIRAVRFLIYYLLPARQVGDYKIPLDVGG